MRSIYNIIDFENSRKRECESDYFNSKFFEMFPTKYEKLLREYEVILFKDNVKTSFLSMDFSDDFLYDGEYSFVERIFLTLFGIIRLKDSEKSFDNFIDFEKIKTEQPTNNQGNKKVKIRQKLKGICLFIAKKHYLCIVYKRNFG